MGRKEESNGVAAGVIFPADDDDRKMNLEQSLSKYSLMRCRSFLSNLPRMLTLPIPVVMMCK